MASYSSPAASVAARAIACAAKASVALRTVVVSAEDGMAEEAADGLAVAVRYCALLAEALGNYDAAQTLKQAASQLHAGDVTDAL